MKKNILSTILTLCSIVFAYGQTDFEVVNTFTGRWRDDVTPVHVFTYADGRQVLLMTGYIYPHEEIRTGDDRTVRIYDYSTKLYYKTIAVYDLSFNLLRIIDLRSRGIPSITYGIRDLEYSGSSVPVNPTHVSETLFNSDDLLEFLIPTRTGFEVVSENGNIVFSKDYGNFYTFDKARILVTNDGNLLEVSGNRIVLGTPFTIIEYFALPGYMMPTGVRSATIEPLNSPFPNPATTFINLPYQLPDQEKQGIVHIYNTAGQLIQSLPVDNFADYVQFNTTNLPTGNYVYNLQVSNQLIQGYTFIVSK